MFDKNPFSSDQTNTFSGPVEREWFTERKSPLPKMTTSREYQSLDQSRPKWPQVGYQGSDTFFYHTSKFRTILHENNGAYTNQTWLLDQKQVVANSEKKPELSWLSARGCCKIWLLIWPNSTKLCPPSTDWKCWNAYSDQTFFEASEASRRSSSGYTMDEPPKREYQAMGCDFELK